MKQFHAGLGIATALPAIDFETRSEAGYLWDEVAGKYRAPRGAMKKGLPAIGAARYAEHPSTDVQWLAYDLLDGKGVRQWMPYGQAHALGSDLGGTPLDLLDYLAGGGLIEAHNNMFERLIWKHVMERRYGWPPVPAGQWRCSMAKARAHALPGSLGMIGDVLRLPLKKDKRGDGLIKTFAMPRDPTKADPRRWIEPHQAAEDFAAYGQYNATDIAAEHEVSIRCPDLEGEELEYWQADQAINWRGVHIDRKGVDDCIVIIDQAHTTYNAELHTLTGGQVARASELAKLKQWLHDQGVHMDVMDDDALDAKLATPLPAPARRALEIRQAVGSASVKKVYAMANMVCNDDRLHDLFGYHAARTGRPTGNGPQPTNLPKAGPEVYRCGCGRHSSPASACAWCNVPRPPGVRTVEWCVEAVEDALEVIGRHNLREVERVFGDAMLAVSGSLRGLFTAAPGMDLIASDYTAIEAVVLAELAGETWRTEVFKARRDIYLESISRSTGVPLADLQEHKQRTGQHHPLRQKGKIQELSLGYGGWLGALRAFGAEGTDEELKAQIVAWREASPAVVELWGGQSRNFGRTAGMFGLEGAAVQAVLYPGQWQHVARLNGTHSGVSYKAHEDALYCRLPSGRHLTYHRPRLEQTGTWRGYSLSFEGYNTNPKAGMMGWVRMQTYSGKLAENVTQAVARDIQRHAGVNLEREGYPIVLHVYDEDVSEVPQGWGNIEEFEAIMNRMPDWATGWPIKASGGWRGRRYRKA